MNDSLISLSHFKNKVVYINFWATWCGPCIKNIPELNALISEYSQNKKVAFINICLDSEKEKWRTSIERFELTGINLYAEGGWSGKLRSYFNVKGILHYVLIDQNNILYEK